MWYNEIVNVVFKKNAISCNDDYGKKSSLLLFLMTVLVKNSCCMYFNFIFYIFIPYSFLATIFASSFVV